jgi:AcrR family transcriptional regulator
MAHPGRRPGKRDTRADILAAARAAFLEEGYERPSLRAIARRAGVDPALVHHYFDGKAALFAEVMRLGRDPREIALEMAAGGQDGTDLAGVFLEQWEEGRPWEGGLSPFVTTCQAVSSSPEAASGLREYLEERVFSLPPVHAGRDDHQVRKALVASQLVGLGWVRYVLQIEPIASAPVDAVARWIGPTLDRYLNEPLDGLAPATAGEPAPGPAPERPEAPAGAARPKRAASG